MNTYIYMYIYIYIYIYVSIHLDIVISVYLYLYIFICIAIHVCLHTSIHTKFPASLCLPGLLKIPSQGSGHEGRFPLCPASPNLEAQGSYNQTITVLITQLYFSQLYLRGF